MMKARDTFRYVLSGSKWCAIGAVVVFGAATSVAFAQGAAAGGQGQSVAVPPLSLGKVFTFLFLMLGPSNVVGPFAAVTLGRDAVFKRRLAFGTFIVSIIALFVAATIGASTLRSWGISIGALHLTAGVILFLVALQPVLAQYKPREPRTEPASAADAPTPPVSTLALSLAFPMIVTPYGIAVLILLATAYPLTAGGLWILGIAVLVLALDLLAMLGADQTAKMPSIGPVLGIVAAVMGILQVALGLQAVADGLRLLGIVGTRNG